MARKNRATLHHRDGFTVIDMGEMEIWDGADLSLLRETLTDLIEKQKRPGVGVDMTFVKYVPSGFFGMLYDWNEKGTEVCVYSPQPHVKQMLWFRQFFVEKPCDRHDLVSEPKEVMAPKPTREWSTTTGWVPTAIATPIESPAAVQETASDEHITVS